MTHDGGHFSHRYNLVVGRAELRPVLQQLETLPKVRGGHFPPPCTFPVPSLYLPCTFPVPSLYFPFLLTAGTFHVGWSALMA